jgi:hypothetical protein
MTRARLDDLATSTLGEILVRMKVVTVEQLEEVLEMQHRLSPEEMLGQLLVAQGLIDNEQLQVALDAQKGLRSKDRTKRAMAMSQLAQASGLKVVDLVSRIEASSRECLRAYGREREPAAVMTKTTMHGHNGGNGVK